ncbi:MAG: hypothetical protein CMH22_07695 [Methylophaga sp.]|nr:hypothetical protein [Methylophaga sp.]
MAMTNTEALFQKIVNILIEIEATTELQAKHWQAPENESMIFETLLSESVSTADIAKAFSLHKKQKLYSESEHGEFIISGNGWGIANDILYMVNPFSPELEELLDSRARGLYHFEGIGVLEGSIFDTSPKNSNENDLDKKINKMIEMALQKGASDIHISPRTNNHISMEFRVDGVKTVYKHDITMDDYALFSNRILAKASTVGGSPTTPLDLKFRHEWNGRSIEIRLAASPVIQGGETHFFFVLRLLNPTGQLRSLEEIGFPDIEVQTLNHLCRSPKGLIIITGPTGSGKSTTLYAMLKRIQELRPGDSLQTIEDPVEVEIQGVEQTQINTSAGMTFASALRSKLRQDPDVILVGELRDLETTKLAIEASMTGHLVLTTLHTNSAVQAIPRLINLGVDPTTLADSLLAISAQRMIRNVCPHCSTKEAFGANTEVSAKYGSLRHSPMPSEEIRIANLKGCEHCDSGYSGRSVASELMIVDPWTQQEIINNKPAHEIEKTHRSNQYMTMWDNGIALVKENKTTVQELESRLSTLSAYGQHFTYGRETNLL